MHSRTLAAHSSEKKGMARLLLSRNSSSYFFSTKNSKYAILCPWHRRVANCNSVNIQGRSHFLPSEVVYYKNSLNSAHFATVRESSSFSCPTTKGVLRLFLPAAAPVPHSPSRGRRPRTLFSSSWPHAPIRFTSICGRKEQSAAVAHSVFPAPPAL
jgi:hypothetical protein